MHQPTLFPTDDGVRPGGDEFLACSDLCEENHFPSQAAMLRAMAGAGGSVFLVVERGIDYNDENLFLADGDGQPQMLFFSRAEAEDAALRRTAAHFRDLPLLEYGLHIDHFTSLTEPELNQGVSTALGIEFDLWADDGFNDRSRTRFPSSATDEQMMAVARLFDKLQFFHVLEAEFGG